MTVEDALKAQTMVEQLFDETALETAAVVAELSSLLVRSPEEFWDRFWELAHPPSPRTAKLFAEGSLSEQTTFGDLVNLSQGGDAAR